MAEILKERGFFWWFNEPSLPANSKEASVSALLTIQDDGQITLDADGHLCPKGDDEDWSKPRILPESRRITGRLASSSAYVLLEGLERTDFSFADELPQQQQFGVQTCTHRDSPFPETYGQDKFIELRIELVGLEDWLGLQSINVNREFSKGEEIHVHVSYRNPDLKYSVLGGTISVESITTGATTIFSSTHPRTELQLRQHYYLVYKPDFPADIFHLRYIYSKIEELLALLIGAYSRLETPILVSKEEPLEAWNTLYFHRGGPSVQSINRFSVWVSFDQVRNVFGDIFRNWMIGSELYGAGYYLYVSSLRNPHHYSEDRFVNLVWGIEALHRKWLPESETSERADNERKRVERILSLLPNDDRGDQKWLRKKLKYAHEPSLEARILESLRKLPFSFGRGEIEKFAKACADRRNDISHTGGPRENLDYNSFHLQISQLAEALDHLLHALLLYQIGVDPPVIFEVMTDSLVSRRIRLALENVGLHISQK